MRRGEVVSALCSLVCVMTLGAAGAARAGETPDRVTVLEERVRELERRLADPAGPVTTAAVRLQDPASEERMARLENAFADLDVQGRPIRTSPGFDWHVRAGGRLHSDVVTERADGALEATVGAIDSGLEFRRARIFFSGVSDLWYDFKLEVDLSGGEADLTDAYLSLPVHYALRSRLGRMKEPFGLENQASSNYRIFHERAMAVSAFTTYRNTGVMLFKRDHAGGPSFWAGYFVNTDSFGVEEGGGQGGHNLTLRLTEEPVMRDEGRRLLHLGLSASRRYPSEGSFRYRALANSSVLPPFADTGAMACDHADVLGAELAMVRGPFSFQIEGVRSVVDLDAGGTATFSGGYAAASWFLTGEYRRYSTRTAGFTRVEPRRPFDGHRGGAWQVALRWSTIDLDDEGAGVAGGQVDELSVALNWHMDANTRMIFGWSRPELDGVGDADVYQVRLQVDF